MSNDFPWVPASENLPWVPWVPVPADPVKCASCGWSGDGGYVKGREHLDVCPCRGDAEVRGFVRAWNERFGKEVAWTSLKGYINYWAPFPSSGPNCVHIDYAPEARAHLRALVEAVGFISERDLTPGSKLGPAIRAARDYLATAKTAAA